MKREELVTNNSRSWWLGSSF